MRNSRQSVSSWWLFFISLIVALVLNFVQYPQWMLYAKPDWLTLVIIYWAVQQPNKMGLGTVWLIGLLLDLLTYTVFGVHAFTKVMLLAIVLGLRKRFRLYTLVQQSLLVFVICSIELLIFTSLQALITGGSIHIVYWQSALLSALLWPLVLTLLSKLDRDRIWE